MGAAGFEAALSRMKSDRDVKAGGVGRARVSRGAQAVP